MADFKYRLISAPEGRVDGSGDIAHDIEAIYSDDGGVTWLVVPNHHKTIVLPSADVATVMAMPDSTGTQRTAKNQAYKDLLVTYRNRQPTPLAPPSASDWSADGLADYMVAYDLWYAEFIGENDDADAAAAAVDEYITVTLSQEYPVEFSL